MPDDPVEPDPPATKVSQIRGTEFDQQTSSEALHLGMERARADAEERRAAALMTAATAKLILDSIDAEHLDLGVILDGATAKVAMMVLNGQVPIRNGTEAAAVVDKFTQARIRMLGGPDGGSGGTGDITDAERRSNIERIQRELEERREAMGIAVASTETPPPT